MASGNTGGWRAEPHTMLPLATLLHPATLLCISQPKEAVSRSVDAVPMLLLHSLATQLFGWLLLLRLTPPDGGRRWLWWAAADPIAAAALPWDGPLLLPPLPLPPPPPPAACGWRSPYPPLL